MCLTVEQVPVNANDYLVTLVYKQVKFEDGKFVTPFTGTIIPEHGWLIPKDKKYLFSSYHNRKVDFSTTPYYGYEANGGLIHFYTEVPPYNVNSMIVDAIAIKTVAFGRVFDGVCRALYIPALDFNGTAGFPYFPGLFRRDIPYSNKQQKEMLKDIVSVTPALKHLL